MAKSPGTYTDHYNTIHGCDSTIVTHLTVTFTSAISGSTSLCQSAAANISYTAVLHPGSSYNWQISGGNIVKVRHQQCIGNMDKFWQQFNHRNRMQQQLIVLRHCNT